MRIISERTLEIDEELRVCFIDWQKAFDRVKWTKLMQILKRTGISWCKRRLISNLYKDQSVNLQPPGFKCVVQWLPAGIFSGIFKFQCMLLEKKSYFIDFSFKFNAIKFGNLRMNLFIRKKIFTYCYNKFRPVNRMHYIKCSVNSLLLT